MHQRRALFPCLTALHLHFRLHAALRCPAPIIPHFLSLFIFQQSTALRCSLILRSLYVWPQTIHGPCMTSHRPLHLMGRYYFLKVDILLSCVLLSIIYHLSYTVHCRLFTALPASTDCGSLTPCEEQDLQAAYSPHINSQHRHRIVTHQRAPPTLHSLLYPLRYSYSISYTDCPYTHTHSMSTSPFDVLLSTFCLALCLIFNI